MISELPFKSTIPELGKIIVVEKAGENSWGLQRQIFQLKKE